MGVEYKHYFVVQDSTWVGSARDGLAVHALLARWGLTDAAPEVHDLNGSRSRKLRRKLTPTLEPNYNIGLLYPSVDGRESIARIMGPSWYENVHPMERYFQGIAFIAGWDFHVHPSDEYFYIEVDDGGASGHEPVESVWPCWSWQIIRADRDSEPPATRVEATGELAVPAGFSGVWRGALVFDCGKDLPYFCGRAVEIPNAEFVRELEHALGTEVAQIGHVY